MIQKTTDDKINELRKLLKEREKFLKTLDSRDAARMGIHISSCEKELDFSYTETTPLDKVQSMINKEIEPLHDKALAITTELCRIYHINCYGCPLSIIGSDGNNNKCLNALKQHLVCQYLTTQFHV